MSLSTVYVIGGPLSLYVRRKRKVKRFNKSKYQKVLLSVKGIKPKPIEGAIMEANNVL